MSYVLEEIELSI